MKYGTFMLCVLLILVGTIPATTFADRASHEDTSKQGVSEYQIDLYYFHYTQRCRSCIAAQRYVERALERYFSDEMEKGIITFQTVNLQTRKGQELSKRFEQSFQGLVINIIQGDNERHYLMRELFMKVHEGEEVTVSYIKNILDQVLQRLAQ